MTPHLTTTGLVEALHRPVYGSAELGPDGLLTVGAYADDTPAWGGDWETLPDQFRIRDYPADRKGIADA